MLTSFTDLLARRPDRTALGAFTCYDLEEAVGVLHAAAKSATGVGLLVGKQSYACPDGCLLLAALLTVADESDVPVCVQLDHCDDLALIESALAAGVGAVMADASSLPYEENVSFVRRAVELARRSGASVEAELGIIEGDEDVALAAAAGALTDPSQAEEFVQHTEVACLAVSIGNVHGTYRAVPKLDWERLEAIHSRVSVPLSLHGASGIPDAMIRRAIDIGIAKINVNTELRGAYLTATEDALPGVLEGSRLAALHSAQIAAVQEVVSTKLHAFDTGSRG
jgi:tagatose 1,6-diphosphate aldolase GatY/KbaY